MENQEVATSAAEVAPVTAASGALPAMLLAPLTLAEQNPLPQLQGLRTRFIDRNRRIVKVQNRLFFGSIAFMTVLIALVFNYGDAGADLGTLRGLGEALIRALGLGLVCSFVVMRIGGEIYASRVYKRENDIPALSEIDSAIALRQNASELSTRLAAVAAGAASADAIVSDESVTAEAAATPQGS